MATVYRCSDERCRTEVCDLRGGLADQQGRNVQGGRRSDAECPCKLGRHDRVSVDGRWWEYCRVPDGGQMVCGGRWREQDVVRSRWALGGLRLLTCKRCARGAPRAQGSSRARAGMTLPARTRLCQLAHFSRSGRGLAGWIHAKSRKWSVSPLPICLNCWAASPRVPLPSA